MILNIFLMSVEAFGNLLSSALNLVGTVETNDSNLYRQRDQQDWNVEQWNRENLYNSPLAQKERLEAAGINPYSVLSQGGADTGNASSPPASVNPIPAIAPNFGNIGSDLVSGLLAMQDYKLKQVDIDKGNADMEFYRIRQVKELIKTDAEISEILSNRDLNQESRSYLENQREVLRNSINSLISKNEAESRAASVTAENLQRRFDDEHFESRSRTLLNKWNVRLSKSQSASLQQGIKESLSRIRRMEFENRLTSQQIATEIEKAANYWADSVNKMTANPKIAAESAFASELQEAMIGYYNALTVGSYANSGRSVFEQLGDYWNEYNVLNSSDEVYTSRRYVRDSQGHVSEIHDIKKGSSKKSRKKSKSFRRR